MSELIRLELKYCERCGGLLLRRSGTRVVYCASCEKEMQAVPAAKARKPEASASSGVVLKFRPAADRERRKACASAVVPEIQACWDGGRA